VPEFIAFRFEVILELDSPVAGLASPLCDAAFAECSGLELTMQAKAIDVGGVNSGQVHLIGPLQNGQITLKRGMTSNLQLWDWFARGTRPGSVLTAHGQIRVLNADGTPNIAFTLTRCLPNRLRAPGLSARGDGGVAVEELTITCDRIQAGALGASLTASVGFGIGITGQASISAEAGVTVSIQGGLL